MESPASTWDRAVFCSYEFRDDINCADAAAWPSFAIEAYIEENGGATGPGVRLTCPACAVVQDAVGQGTGSLKCGLAALQQICNCSDKTRTTRYTTGDGRDAWIEFTEVERSQGKIELTAEHKARLMERAKARHRG